MLGKDEPNHTKIDLAKGLVSAQFILNGIDSNSGVAAMIELTLEVFAYQIVKENSNITPEEYSREIAKYFNGVANMPLSHCEIFVDKGKRMNNLMVGKANQILENTLNTMLNLAAKCECPRCVEQRLQDAQSNKKKETEIKATAELGGLSDEEKLKLYAKFNIKPN